jgi:hypothetical protein
MIRTYAAVLLAIASTEALAAACEVSTRSLSQKIPAVVTQSCYVYEGIEEGAIKWSCSQEDDVGMYDYDKKLVETCPSDYLATCTSTLTQESLANHKAIGDIKTGTPMAVPDGARMITHFYNVEEQEQARKNCTTLGGNWQEKPNN